MALFVQIISNCWLSSFPVTTTNNKSFGTVTISELHEALTNVKRNKVSSELEQWIHTTGFLGLYPPELVVGHPTDAFARILNQYNNLTEEFLTSNPKFYLWIQSK